MPPYRLHECVCWLSSQDSGLNLKLPHDSSLCQSRVINGETYRESIMGGSQFHDHPGTWWFLNRGALRLPGNKFRSPGHPLPKPEVLIQLV